MSIFHIGTLYAKPEYKEALIQSFGSLKEAPGYIAHSCYADLEDENKVTLIEQRRSRKFRLLLSTRRNGKMDEHACSKTSREFVLQKIVDFEIYNFFLEQFNS